MKHFSLALLLIPVLFGCGGASGNQRETAPVKVTLTLDGSPLADASIAFVASQDPVPASGKTDANGVAEMTTYTSGDGAVLGNHNVMVVKNELTGKEAADQDSAAYDPNATGVKVKGLIPAKYSNPGTSGFVAEVKKGKNEFTFDLKSK